MSVVWSQWRLFPDPQSGIPFDAATGPGLFEVRNIGTGEQVAFAVSADVANSLATLISPPASVLRSIFTRRRISHRSIDLEYRTCAAASMSEARSEADRLNGLRRAYLQRRKAAGRA
jgi:hypothetical protein